MTVLPFNSEQEAHKAVDGFLDINPTMIFKILETEEVGIYGRK